MRRRAGDDPSGDMDVGADGHGQSGHASELPAHHHRVVDHRPIRSRAGARASTRLARANTAWVLRLSTRPSTSTREGYRGRREAVPGGRTATAQLGDQRPVLALPLDPAVVEGPAPKPTRPGRPGSEGSPSEPPGPTDEEGWSSDRSNLGPACRPGRPLGPSWSSPPPLRSKPPLAALRGALLRRGCLRRRGAAWRRRDARPSGTPSTAPLAAGAARPGSGPSCSPGPAVRRLGTPLALSTATSCREGRRKASETPGITGPMSSHDGASMPGPRPATDWDARERSPRRRNLPGTASIVPMSIACWESSARGTMASDRREGRSQ